VTDPDPLGLTREVVVTPLGPVVVRTGRRTGDVATVLLHGAAGSWTTWAPLLAADPAIPDVVAPDLPGWGESAAAARPADVAAMSGAVAAVARALGYDRWAVLGHSLGGFVALDLAAREPVATVAVGLVSPTGAAVVDAIRRPLRGGLRLPWFAGMLLAMRALAALPGSGRGLLRLLDRSGLLRPLAAPLFAEVGRVDEAVIAALAEEIRPLAFLLATRAAAAYDLGTWRGVRCPVRTVRGARDVFVGAGDEAALARLVPGVAGLVLPDAGHFAAIERPDAVLRFLSTARTAPEARE
jgi:pimeloyl-ACP methyl ester carboxylesterase